MAHRSISDVELGCGVQRRSSALLPHKVPEEEEGRERGGRGSGVIRRRQKLNYFSFSHYKSPLQQRLDFCNLASYTRTLMSHAHQAHSCMRMGCCTASTSRDRCHHHKTVGCAHSLSCSSACIDILRRLEKPLTVFMNASIPGTRVASCSSMTTKLRTMRTAAGG